MLRLLTIGVCVLFTLQAVGQGTIRGKVTDNLGESLIGVTIVQKGKVSNGALTDFDGLYSLKIAESTPVVLIITYVGFKTIEDTVNPQGNEVIIRNYKLQSASVEVKEVEVSAKAIKAANYYMEDMKKKSATTIDYVSSETMRKTGDNNVSSAIARVTGVSNTSAGFITVRGIGDRYLRTNINGAAIPTLDPFTNNIRLDFLPANLVDNIIITKTASPDLPGNWAGAYISIETKDYPEELTVAAETQFGYNLQSTFQNVLSGERSNTDWLGYDNGFRDRDHSMFFDYVSRPNDYQEMVALGLSDFYKNLGVTAPWDPNSPAAQDLFKLGLVELGLLAPALINDAAAVAAATANYESTLALDAFSVINDGASKQNQNFANSWLLGKRKAPLNFSQSFGVGNQHAVGKKSTLGYIFGLRYSTSNQFDESAVLNRARVNADGTIEANTFFGKQQLARENNGWSALSKLAFKLNPNHSFSVLFMPNLNGSNSVRNIVGTGIFEDQPDAIYTSYDQFYEERRQLVYQYESDHYIPSLKTKIELKGSFTDGKSDIPDFRSFSTFSIDGQLASGLGNLPNTRDFRYLNEDLSDVRLSLEFPIKEVPGKSRKVKLGGAYSYLDRTFDQYQYILGGTDSIGNILTGSYAIPDNDLEAFLQASSFAVESYNFQGLPKRRSKLLYINNDFPGNRTIGNSEILAYFAMFDYSLSFKWRVSGGVRVEHARIFGDIREYYEKGYAPDDIRRRAEGDDFIANPGDIDVTKILPSLNIVYKYLEDEKRSRNIRANYSRTTAYPSIREITENNVLDFELRTFVIGNSNLKPADVDNFDLRWETFTKGGNSFSVSAFGKKFKNHIELLNFNETNTWTNVEESYVAGIELEGVYKVTKSFEVRANVSVMDSETEVILKARRVVDDIVQLVPYDTLKRTMYGQAPFVVNTIFNYTFEKLKGAATLSYNVQGKRLVISATENLPDIYEMPRHIIDVKFTKNIGKHFVTSLTIRDILNQPVKREYDVTNNQQLDFDSYRWGTSVNLGLTYRL